MRDFSTRYIPVTESGCWLWTGLCSPRGYGVMRQGAKLRRAHRVSYELHQGAIPEGQIVCHHCDVPCCVNPSHLFLGTIDDNNQDMKRKGRYNAARGERCGASKISEDQMRLIRNDMRPRQAIMDEFGISRSQIYRIKNMQTWRHS